MYIMENSYGGSTTALATTKDSQHVVSGSNIGHVVIWEVPESKSLKHGYAASVTKHDLLKEHKAKVTCIKINAKGTECVSSSADGSCIIWDLVYVPVTIWPTGVNKYKNLISCFMLFPTFFEKKKTQFFLISWFLRV